MRLKLHRTVLSLNAGSRKTLDGALLLACLVRPSWTLRVGFGWDQDLPLKWHPVWHRGPRTTKGGLTLHEMGWAWLGVFLVIGRVGARLTPTTRPVDGP